MDQAPNETIEATLARIDERTLATTREIQEFKDDWRRDIERIHQKLSKMEDRYVSKEMLSSELRPLHRTLYGGVITTALGAIVLFILRHIGFA